MYSERPFEVLKSIAAGTVNINTEFRLKSMSKFQWHQTVPSGNPIEGKNEYKIFMNHRFLRRELDTITKTS